MSPNELHRHGWQPGPFLASSKGGEGPQALPAKKKGCQLEEGCTPPPPISTIWNPPPTPEWLQVDIKLVGGTPPSTSPLPPFHLPLFLPHLSLSWLLTDVKLVGETPPPPPPLLPRGPRAAAGLPHRQGGPRRPQRPGGLAGDGSAPIDPVCSNSVCGGLEKCGIICSSGWCF